MSSHSTSQATTLALLPFFASFDGPARMFPNRQCDTSPSEFCTMRSVLCWKRNTLHRQRILFPRCCCKPKCEGSAGQLLQLGTGSAGCCQCLFLALAEPPFFFWGSFLCDFRLVLGELLPCLIGTSIAGHVHVRCTTARVNDTTEHVTQPTHIRNLHSSRNSIVGLEHFSLSTHCGMMVALLMVRQRSLRVSCNRSRSKEEGQSTLPCFILVGIVVSDCFVLLMIDD
jgi:hypothetical protein